VQHRLNPRLVALEYALLALPALLIAMMIVFAARAVGDFKYMGFFKSVKGTKFALWDTRMYSPLNVVLSVLAGLSLR